MAERKNYVEYIEKRLTEEEYKFKRKQREESDVFSMGMKAKNTPGIDLNIYVESGDIVKIRTYLAENIPHKRWDKVKSTLNDLNHEFRYINLVLDKDGDVCCDYDMILMGEEENAFQQLMLMVMIFKDICDKCIPNIMRSIWKEEEASEEPEDVINMDLFHKKGGMQS